MFRSFVPKLALAISLASTPVISWADHHNEKEPVTLKPADGHYLGIPRDALGQKFLISISVIPQSLAATSTGLAGKIVTFELFADGVDLFEDPEGLVVTDELPARRLVASFPIISKNEELITIDFNAGMRRAFADIWYSVSRSFNPFSGEQTYEIPGSRVFEVSENSGQLVIRQSAQVRSRQFSADMENRYEIRYFIKPYKPGDYQGKEYNKQYDRHVRFFETAARLERTTGRAATKIARFDINKPLKFYYSSNTPADYVDAVKGGIEYWNRAFGRKVVEVAKAPEGITAPDAGHNIVQWVPWDNAGFAYADILVDPITGESQRGQAYMTSTFAISGKARARQILRRMRAIADRREEEEGEKKDGDEKKHNHAPFWPTSAVCQVSLKAFAKQYAEGLEKVLANPEISDEMVLQMSQDYIRGIVAHEVGHVLGLRHNFAGSLDSTVSHQRLNKWLSAYLKQEDLSEFENDYTANSMMEYQIFPAMALTGSKMRTTETVLPHDRGAIQWGYYDDAKVAEDKTLFASDDDMSRWNDVSVFDYGTEPVIAAYAEIADTISQLPNFLIETFIRAKAPRDPRDRVPLEKVNLNVGGTARSLGFELRNLLRWFSSSARSLTIENQFDFVGDLNRQEVLKAHWKRLNEQIEALGGVDRAIFSFMPEPPKLDPKKKPKNVKAAPPVKQAELTKSLETLLESPAYQKFVGLDDQEYEFTDDEKKLITERAILYFDKLSDRVVLEACNVFGAASRDLALEANETLDDDDIVANLEKRIIEFASKVILAKDDKKIIKGKIEKARVEVIDYKYSLETRLAAAKMLSDRVGSYKSWSKEGKSDINKKLRGEVEAALNIKLFKSFKDSMLSRSLRKWHLDQQEILKLLPGNRSATPPVPSK
ncbi:MAG: hypothetical protein M2R45_05368 [Verrucomicrobia subdivision 3 bacterium]|nr:hypothetical protein [Limisphaerales bacterium]MCS1417776.1 hypothetical protein [Limisphaerales bacterium]